MRKIFSLIAAVLFAGSMMAETYTKTAYADLQTGDQIIITMQKGDNVYAASNDQGTSKGPVATAVTVSNDAITTDATNILWTVEKNGDNISFKTGNDYLYCTNTNNGVRVGSGENNVFSIDASSGYLFNNGHSRFIGVYNGTDWRCYTSVNANISGQTLAFFAAAGGEVPPTPTDTYTVAGSPASVFGSTWDEADATNDMVLANGIYKWEKEVQLSAGTIEFKVVKNHDWNEGANAYPANNYVLNIVEEGTYTITITFDPATETVAAEAVLKVIPQYEVAEAIAAGLTDNTELFVRGVITKMEIKGKNFAKFGSVNIYVADATGAAGEFEFYNCYSLSADTFRTTTPAYDAASTAIVELNEAADENGNTIHVGDTVIAFGKYKLYSGTHELNTGCYLTEIKPAAPAEEYYLTGSFRNWATTAESDFHFVANPAAAGEYMLKGIALAANAEIKVIGILGENVNWYPAVGGNYTVEAEGEYDIYFRPDGQGGQDWHQGYFYVAAVAPAEPTTCFDVYQMAKGDVVDLLNDVTVTYANGKNVWVVDGSASMLIYFSANTTYAPGDVLSGIAGTVDIYNGVTEIKPSADQAAAIVATPGEVPAAIQTVVVEAADVNKYIVMPEIEFEEDAAFVEGTASNITMNGVVVRNNFKNGYAFEAGRKYNIYGVVTIYQNNPQVYFITAEKIIGTAIDNTNIDTKVIKTIENGQLIIIKNGVRYNAQGAVVR